MSLVDVEDGTLTQVAAIESFFALPSEDRFEDMVHVLRRGSKKSRQRIVRAFGRAAKLMGGWPAKDSYYSILRKIASSRGWLKGSAYTFASFERMASIDTVWALRIPDRESDKAILEAHLSTYPSYYM